MIKKSYVLQMSYDVSSQEKQAAKEALLLFKEALVKLNLACDHLNIMKTPFKDNQDISPDSLVKARAAIRRFRDKSLDNFNIFKIICFKCVKVMKKFSSDTQSVKLMKSFTSSIEDLEKLVNKFLSLFSNLESKDFVKNIINIIEKIQKKSDDIREIVEDRICQHIAENILSLTWIDEVGHKLNDKISDNVPLLLQLFNERQDEFAKMITDRNNLGQ